MVKIWYMGYGNRSNIRNPYAELLGIRYINVYYINPCQWINDQSLLWKTNALTMARNKSPIAWYLNTPHSIPAIIALPLYPMILWMVAKSCINSLAHPPYQFVS